MNPEINLRDLERKAYRSTFQDGLWDIYLGMIIIFMAIFLHRSEQGYAGWNIVFMLLGFGIANILFWTGKKVITVPRMGQVAFGPIRRRRAATLAMVLGVVVAIQAGIVLLSIAGWANPEFGARIEAIFKTGDLEKMAVAAIGSLFVGPSMILVAYFTDFPRGYFIGVAMALAVFLMIWLDRPVYPIILGGLVLLPGMYLFIRFLRRYPYPKSDAFHD